MARLTVSYIYTQTQIDEYINRGISNFMGAGGNIPWGEFIKKYGSKAFTRIQKNERFYLSKQPFAYCGGIKADYSYKQPIFSENDCAPITGINLISLSTRKTVCLDIRSLLTRGKFHNGETYRAKGIINTHIFNVISRAVPYITLREVLQETVQFIGNKHIYFEEELVCGEKEVPELERLMPCRIYILNGYFAENVCHYSR